MWREASCLQLRHDVASPARGIDRDGGGGSCSGSCRLGRRSGLLLLLLLLLLGV
jgi:hypothetical protein